MIITTKKEKILFNVFFKTVNDLKNFIKEKNKFINVNALDSEFTIIYDNLSNSDESHRLFGLEWFIISKFKFKFKRPNTLNFWIERGYTIEEYNNFLENKKYKSLCTEINNDNENYFKYKNIKFKMKGEPKCNLCKSLINFRLITNNYKIFGCTNNKCHSNFNKEIKMIGYLAFLPFDVLKQKNKHIDITNKSKLEYWIMNGYSYNESLIKRNEIKKILNLPENKNNIKNILKITKNLTEEEINLKLKINSHLTKEYWLNKGFSEKDAREKINKFQTNSAKAFAKKRKETPNLYSASTNTSIGYWLNRGFSDDEAKKQISERQTTFTLDKCIKKYGEEDGTKIYNDRQINWIATLRKNGNLTLGFSRISQELFNRILELYNESDKKHIHYATHNKEYSIGVSKNSYYLYDFTDLKNKKIIEYHGDKFHGNPKKYSENDTPNPLNKKIKAKDMWIKDKLKENKAIEKGFDVLVIWDSDYLNNKELIIKKIINFLFN